MAGDHFREVCEYGQTHSQCRCIDRNKSIRSVACNMPARHAQELESGDVADATEVMRLAYLFIRQARGSLAPIDVARAVLASDWLRDRERAAVEAALHGIEQHFRISVAPIELGEGAAKIVAAYREARP